MFNGIIYNTGKVKYHKNKKSILLEFKSKLNLIKKI